MREMKETFKLNHANETIELTKQFAKASGKYDSEEYKLLMEVKKDFPNYKIVVKDTPKRKQPKDNYKGLTYEYMERYIKTKENHEELLKEFYELRGIGTGYDAIIKTASYIQVKKWFLNAFPEIDAYKDARKEACEEIDRKAKERKTKKQEEQQTQQPLFTETIVEQPKVLN